MDRLSLSRRQRKQRTVYRWAVLGTLALATLGSVFPIGAFLRPDSAVARYFLSDRNCRAILSQGVPLLGVHLAGSAPLPAPGEDEPDEAQGLVAVIFGALTGTRLGEPGSFLTAGLPLTRSPYAEAILTAGSGTSGGGDQGGSGGPALSGPGSGASDGAGGGLPSDTAPGSGSDSSLGPGSPAGGLPGGAIEDRNAQIYLYGGVDPVIAIVHTHGSESFLASVTALAQAKDPRVDVSSLEAFTTDNSANMLRVGEELARYLSTTLGIPVVQSRRLHDALADGFRLGAYERSLTTMTEILRHHPTVKIMLDLHRDSPSRSVTTATIKGVSMASILTIVGTDRLLDNPHWQDNYTFARRLVAAMEKSYPGLSRGILVRDERYNQHVMQRTLLLEIGGQENTLEEIFASARALGDVLGQIVAAGFEQ